MWRWALILGQDLYVLNHTWSLAIEEQFYLAWPIVLAILLRVRQRGSVIAVPAATILVATIPLYRMILGWHSASLSAPPSRIRHECRFGPHRMRGRIGLREVLLRIVAPARLPLDLSPSLEGVRPKHDWLSCVFFA